MAHQEENILGVYSLNSRSEGRKANFLSLQCTLKLI